MTIIKNSIQKYQHICVKYILLIVGYISAKMSSAGRLKLGKIIAFVLRNLSRKRATITYNNIKAAFPEYSEMQCMQLVRASYVNIGIVLAEVPCMRYFKEEDYRKYVKYENIELIEQNRDTGMILMSAHFGNWEFLAYSIGLFMKIPVLIVVKHQKNKMVDTILNQYRTRSGNQVVSMNKAARSIVKTIRSGGVVAMLADQSAIRNNGIVSKYFGRDVLTYSAPAELAIKFKVPVICGFAHRGKDGTYTVKLTKLETSDLHDFDDPVLELTKRHVADLEKEVREQPEMWTWQHRRWKYKSTEETNN